MNWKEAIVLAVGSGVIGAFIGLIIRIFKEDIGYKYLFHAIILSLNYLIIYPFIIFPIIILSNKELVAEILMKNIKVSNSSNIKKDRKRLKNRIIKNLTFKHVLRMWGMFAKDVSKNYDMYIDENMSLIQNTISERRTTEMNFIKNQANTFTRQHQNEMNGLYCAG